MYLLKRMMLPDGCTQNRLENAYFTISTVWIEPKKQCLTSSMNYSSAMSMALWNSASQSAVSSHHIGFTLATLLQRVVGTAATSFSYTLSTPLSLASTQITKFLYIFSLISSTMASLRMGPKGNFPFSLYRTRAMALGIISLKCRQTSPAEDMRMEWLGQVSWNYIWWWSRRRGGWYLPPTSTTTSDAYQTAGSRLRVTVASRNWLVNLRRKVQASTSSQWNLPS